MSRAEERIRGFESRHPAAVRLAEAVSLAVLADPPLLRKARRDLVPGADPGTEADLWLSPLVQTRSPDGLVFAPDVAEALRARLAMEPDRLDRAWRITQAMHRHLTPALRLEEEIAWLAVSPDPQAAARIEELLRSALAALTAGERRGLVYWVARALPKLPSRVRVSEAARMLEAGARLRLRGDARSLKGEEGLPDWLSAVAPADLPRLPVAVRLFEGAVEIDARPSAEGQTLLLPETDPLLVELSWDAPGGGRQSRQATLRKGEVQKIAVPVQDVRLRTVLGEVYDLRKAGTAPRGLQDWILDFSEERARHRPFFGRIEEQEQIQSALRAASLELLPGAGRLILVTGELGAGKSALLAHVIDRLKEQDLEPPHHFFRRGRARLEDVAVAEKSLIAQIARRFPEVALKARHLRLPALLEELLDRKLLGHETQPLILVLDAVDEAEANEGQRDNALLEILPAELPDHVVVLASAQAGGEEGLRLPGPILHVRLAEAESALLEFWHRSFQVGNQPASNFADLAQGSSKNFGVARLMAAYVKRYSQLRTIQGSSAEGLGLIWEILESQIGRNGMGIFAAALGPLPASLANMGQTVDTPALRESQASEEPMYEIAEEVLRDYIALRLDLSNAHWLLADRSAAAILDEAATEQARRYGLEHAADHRLAAGDLEWALSLHARIDFLTSRFRDLGMPSVRRGLWRWLSTAAAKLVAEVSRERLVLGPPSALKAKVSQAETLLDSLTQVGARLESRPEDLPDLLYTELRLRSWDPKTIGDFLQLPAGTPALRLANPFPPDSLRRRPPVRHRGAVTGCAFVEAGGSAILSWSTDGTLRLWNDTSGDLRALLQGHHGAVTACAILPGGLALSASHSLRLWDLETGKLMSTLSGHGGQVLGLLTLPSNRAVSWSNDQTIRIWDLAAGRQDFELHGHDGPVTACALTPDNRYLITGSEDCTVRIWRARTGSLLRTWRGHAAAVTGLAVTPSGEHVLSCSRDRTVRIWPVVRRVGRAVPSDRKPPDDGRPPFSYPTLTGPSSGLLGCRISEDGTRLAGWSLDRKIWIWDLQEIGDPSPKPRMALEGHKGAVLACTFSEGRLLSCSADRSVKVWDMKSGELLFSHEEHEGAVRAMVPVADRLEYVGRGLYQRHNAFVSASDDRTLRVGSLQGLSAETLLDGDNETLLCLPFPDRRRVATVSRHGDLDFHSIDEPAPAPSWGGLEMPIGGGVALPDGRRVVLWSQRTGRRGVRFMVVELLSMADSPLDFEGHRDAVLDCAVTPNSRILLSASRDGSVRLNDLETGNEIGVLEAGSPVAAIQVDVSGRLALAGLWNGTLLLWDLETRRAIHTLTGHTDRVLACAIAPDGRRAISAAGDRTLRIWDLETGSALSILTGHTADVTGCAFTGDGRRIVSRSKDGRIGLWDGGSGSLVAFTTGHTDWVNAFALAEEEGVVYSCSEDQTVRAWDLVTGEPRGVVYGVSPFRSLAAVAGGVYAGDEAGNLWILEYGEGLRRAVA
jgi:WD40 repeat protein